ncbi:MAG: hypothetical protein K0V04_43405 [Deltaproteobacteria bacterium]|nr:hypothetical protein [Deltaproteobacteria bacterium]
MRCALLPPPGPGGGAVLEGLPEARALVSCRYAGYAKDVKLDEGQVETFRWTRGRAHLGRAHPTRPDAGGGNLR